MSRPAPDSTTPSFAPACPCTSAIAHSLPEFRHFPTPFPPPEAGTPLFLVFLRGKGRGRGRVASAPCSLLSNCMILRSIAFMHTNAPPLPSEIPNLCSQHHGWSLEHLICCFSCVARAGEGGEPPPLPAAFSATATVWSRDLPLSCVQMPLPCLLKLPILGLQHHARSDHTSGLCSSSYTCRGGRYGTLQCRNLPFNGIALRFPFVVREIVSPLACV